MIRRHIKNKKGMTLIEIILGISLFSILSVTTSAIIGPVMSAVKDVSSYSEVNGLLDNLANEITSNLAEAAVVSYDNDSGKLTITTTSYHVVEYEVDKEEKIIYKNGAPLIAKGFYNGNIVNFGLYDADSISDIADIDDETLYKHVTPNTKVFLLLLKMGDSEHNLLMRKAYLVKPLVSNQYN